MDGGLQEQLYMWDTWDGALHGTTMGFVGNQILMGFASNKKSKLVTKMHTLQNANLIHTML